MNAEIVRAGTVTEMDVAVHRELLRRAPKAVLHDHLDGGLRPQTVIDLARESSYHHLPTTNPVELAGWFAAAGASGSLERYLEPFAHTVAVTQTAESLTRVAREAVLDLAADGVVYAEIRFAPELHTRRELSAADAVVAVLDGLRLGEKAAAADGMQIRARLILCAMRMGNRSREIAELVVAYRVRGTSGFDIAGAEAGYPPDLHKDAFDYLRTHDASYTIHAGEAFGLPSIKRAIHECGTRRLGHGIRISDDVHRTGDTLQLGPTATYVRDQGIALEICPTSNVHTAAAASIAAHPFKLLDQAGFTVTVNTDNRLISATTMTDEASALTKVFNYTLADLNRFTVNAVHSAFLSESDKQTLIDSVINPGYASLQDA